MSTVAHQIPAAGDVVPDEGDKIYEDIDSTYYEDGRPESMKNFEHPRGQAITPAEKATKEDARQVPAFDLQTHLRATPG